MAGSYRYWCGECPFRTQWSTESQGAERQARHYARHHADVRPGGRVEFRETTREGAVAVVFVAVLLLLLPILVLCTQLQS